MKIIISYISEAWEIISSGSIEKDELLVTGGRCKGSISRSFQDSKNFLVFIMSWVTQQAEICQNFIQKRNRLLQKRNVIVLTLSKRIYINLAHAFSFFLVVWSQSLKVLACFKIGIRECYFFVYQMHLYLPHNNWFVLQLKQGVQGLQAFAFSAATDDGTTSAFQICSNSQYSYVSC